MHRCLSCNQPCSLFSAFCDTCRASLLARRDQVIAEEQPEMIRAGSGSGVEGGYPAWEMGEGMADLMSFPQPEAAPVGSQVEQAQAVPPVPGGENDAWSFETSGIYAVETMDGCVEMEGVKDVEGVEKTENTRDKAGIAQATHAIVVPPRPRRVMPRNVRRALLVFCVVGVLALLTDGILLALSISRHHVVVVGTRPVQLRVAAPQGASPTAGYTPLTPTSAAQINALSMFALSSQRLAFSAVQGQTNLVSQTVTLSANQQGFSWRIEPLNTLAAWLRLSAWQGTVKPGVTASFVVNAHPTGLAPGLYTANVLVKAFDAQGNALSGSPATLMVTLNVHPPCVLSVTPARISFVAVLVSAPTPQTLTLSESSSCAFPVSWQVSTDASWVTFSRSSGTDSASGSSIVVQTSSAGKLIGSYTASITFQGTDNSGAPLVVEPAEITATLTVIG